MGRGARLSALRWPGPLRVAAGALTLATMVAACHRSEPPAEDTQGPPSGQLPAASAAPIVPSDHLAPGELVEGTRQAFGVTLPRVLQVRATFVDAVYANGPASIDALVPYFRKRLRGGTFTKATSVATFQHTHAEGQPGRDLEVHIATSSEGATVELRDTTPPAAPVLPDEAARWKRLGLTTSGRPIDPTHLE